MYDRTQRVAERLQSERRPDTRLIVEVPWIMVFTAFTAPGRYVYFCRRLLERCPDDETAAFVIAHEIAHHDLGHLNVFETDFARRAAKHAGATAAILFFKHLQKRLFSPEWETEADRRAIELCVAAGYDGSKCVHLFDIMEHYCLDYGDLDGVFGIVLDEPGQELLPGMNEALAKAQIWLHQRVRGYLPIRERRAIVRRYVDFMGPRRAPWWPGRPG
jgi:hypothetical protein